MVGFSLGGRVAICIAAFYPHLVNRLSVTGVPYCRPALGKIIIDSWAQLLSRNNTEDCAWSFLINGYSPDFIEKYEKKLPDYVDAIVESNDPKKLLDLILHGNSNKKNLQGKENENEDLYSIPNCVTKIKCPTQVSHYCLPIIALNQNLKTPIPNYLGDRFFSGSYCGL